MRQLVAAAILGGIIIIALTALLSHLTKAHGAEAPRARVVQAFRILSKSPWHRHILQMPRTPHYDYDHPAVQISGKAFLLKECPYDMRNDPGEASCKIVWAEI